MITGLYGVCCFLIGLAFGVEVTRRVINAHYIAQRRKK